LDTINYFDKISGEYQDFTFRKSEFLERYETWFTYIDKYKSDNFKYALDVGCGNGIITAYLLKYYNTTAVDGSMKMLEIVSETLNYFVSIKKLNLVNTNLPFDDNYINNFEGKFDFITLSSVIEYVDNDMLLMQQLFSLLKPKGILLLSFPNKSSFYRKFEMLVIKRFHKHTYLKYVRRFYRKKDFDRLSTGIGFETLEENYYALPKPNIFRHFFGKSRPKWFAALCISVLRKN
jgi:SAM-dependent methyltransferase